MQGQTYEFHCRACGHVFNGAWDVISKQPTCPKCRTYGQLTDANGNTVGGGKQNVVRVQRPGAAPYAAGGPVDYAGEEDDVVEVRADVVYGGKNSKSLVTTLVLVGLGVGIVLTLFFIVSVLRGNPEEEARQQREVVLDPKEFERAVDESVGKVRALLKSVPDAEVQETTNFDEAIKAIVATGGTGPGWTAPPQPGTPFRAHGFLVTAKDKRTGFKVVGFVMLLYYKTAEEVGAAKSQIDRELGGDTRNYGIQSNPAMWFVSYMGVNYKGELKDALDRSMRLGAPATYKQFTDRTGSTLREEAK